VCADPCKALLVNKGLEWIEGCHQNVQPQVEFVAMEKEGVLDIPLDDDLRR